MGYIAKADLTIFGKSHELYHIIKGVGYVDGSERGNQLWDNHLTIENGKLYSGMLEACNFDYLEDFIDCNAYTPNGTEEEAVKLFLELAQMDNDDASTLWVKVDKLTEIHGDNCWVERSYHKDWSSSSDLIEAVRKGWVSTLSPLQFAQTFKDGGIKL